MILFCVLVLSLSWEVLCVLLFSRVEVWGKEVVLILLCIGTWCCVGRCFGFWVVFWMIVLVW